MLAVDVFDVRNEVARAKKRSESWRAAKFWDDGFAIGEWAWQGDIFHM
jgi:hypothetical protein